MTERKRAEGLPWFLVLKLCSGEEKRFRELSDLEFFRVTIRETGNTRRVADMPIELIEDRELCADVLEKAQAMVREAGPEGSNFEHLYLWSDDKKCVIELGHFIPDNMLTVDEYDDSATAYSATSEDYTEQVFYSVDDLLARLRNQENTT